MDNKEISKIEKIIDYNFKNEELLKLAFIHSSNGKPNNQRLEFLGDSVLDLVVSNILFKNEESSEGELTKKRATLVCEQTLAQIIKQTKLDSFLVFGKSYKGKATNAICADLFESIVGAIYIDNQYSIKEVTMFVKKFIDLSVCDSIDYITSLQELVFQNKDAKIEYKSKEIDFDGENHKFECELYINGLICASAFGSSKKEAKKNVAKIVYENLIRMNETWYLKK